MRERYRKIRVGVGDAGEVWEDEGEMWEDEGCGNELKMSIMG
jgi:hypothetical protein